MNENKAIGRLFFTAACVLALTATGSAQQSAPAFRSHSVHSASAEKLPHSLPNSSVAAAANANTVSSRKELDRLERTGTPARGTVAQHASSARVPRINAIGKTSAHSAPISFAYAGPKGGQVGHRSTPTRHR